MSSQRNENMLDFERSLLATMMLRPADCWRVDVSPIHLMSEQHAEILTAIRDLSGASQSCDPLSVCDHFGNMGKPHLGTLALQISAGMNTAVPEAYAARIVAGWRQRAAKAIGAELAGSSDPKAVDAAIAGLMALHATEQKHEYSAKEAAKQAVEELNRVHEAGGKMPGVTTGLRDLDDKLGGLHPGDLIVVGGRAAMGKTSSLLGMARAAALSGSPVGIISGEQPAVQMTQRMVAAESGLSAKTFRNAAFEEHEWHKVFIGFETVAGLPLWMLDRSAPSLADVVRVARRWVHQHGIKALYIDYLQRIVGEGERKFEQVGMVARGLKNLARDLNIPIVVLAQVSRAVEGRASPIPHMGDLSDSSEIEKEADQVLMLYREGYYDMDARQDVARVIVDKNRHGPTGYVEVSWAGETMTFGDLHGSRGE